MILGRKQRYARTMRYFPRIMRYPLMPVMHDTNGLRMSAYVPNIRSFVVKQDVDHVSTSRSTMLIDASC